MKLFGFNEINERKESENGIEVFNARFSEMEKVVNCSCVDGNVYLSNNLSLKYLLLNMTDKKNCYNFLFSFSSVCW